FPPPSGGLLGLTRQKETHEPHEGSQTRDRSEAWVEPGRHGLDQGAGRAAHAADQPADRAPADASEGPLLATRAAQAGRPTPPFPELSPEARPGGVPGTDQGIGAAEVAENVRPSQAEAGHGKATKNERWRFERAPTATLTRVPTLAKQSGGTDIWRLPLSAG